MVIYLLAGSTSTNCQIFQVKCELMCSFGPIVNLHHTVSDSVPGTRSTGEYSEFGGRIHRPLAIQSARLHHPSPLLLHSAFNYE